MSKDYIVPDVLEPRLKLVFCGTAPSEISAQEKAYYANPANQFWKVLHRVRLTPSQFKPQQYRQLLTLGMGLTDLCKTQSGNDDELSEEHIDCDALKSKILRYQPKLVAFTSKHAGTRFLNRKVDYGLQPEALEDTKFFVLCSTSGRARRFWREDVWTDLAAQFSGLR